MKKYIRRIGLGVGTLGLIIVGAATFSGFEARIINVTARIENALSINAGASDRIEFGTVFPQEYLTRDIQVSLSDSFNLEDRVDDVEYTIKQKPKVKEPCLVVQNSSKNLLTRLGLIHVARAQTESCNPQDPNANPSPGDPYATITVGNFVGPAWQYCENSLPADSNLTDNIGYTVDLSNPYWNYCYLPLANNLSKHELTTDGTEQENDVSVEAFHQAYIWNGGSHLNPDFIASGRLVKALGDLADTWQIDLKVPCFVNQCAQEASDIENDIDDDTPGFYVPNEFRLDPATEHSVFGTDLWIEVTNISLPGRVLACGILLTADLPTGDQLNTNTTGQSGNYDYIMPATNPATAGNSADHSWVQVNLNGEGVWDMGAGSVSSVWMIPSIDHDPYPGENSESLIYYGDTPTGPWTLATRTSDDPNGPSNWDSDNGAGLWVFAGVHRYVRAISSETNPTDAALVPGIYLSDDTEIDAICTQLDLLD